MARSAHAPARQRAQTPAVETQEDEVPQVSNEAESQPEAQGSAQEPDQESIAVLAYSFWLERQGGGQGSAEEDWLRAEHEIRAKLSLQS